MSRLRRTALAAGMLLVLGPVAASGSGSARAAAPYPRSKVVTGVSWETGTHQFAGIGGDLWATTSGADGRVYTAWGDGVGACPAYVSYGTAVVRGGPGAGLVGTGCGPSGYGHGKIVSLLAVGRTLYATALLQGLPGGRTAIAVWRSADRGATWRKPAWTFAGGDLRPGSFVNFGPGYAGARDRYVYLTATRPDRPTLLYMVRVPRGSLQTKAAYEYLTGSAAAPAWTTRPAAASPIFVDPNGVDAPELVYDRGLGRYLLTASHGREGANGSYAGVFEGPEPWGPWATVDYRDDWLGILPAGSSYLGVGFPSAWMADGGRTLWAVFSCWSKTLKLTGVEACGVYDDRYNLMRATLRMAPGRR